VLDRQLALGNGERAVHHEFHISRAARLVAGGGDLLGHLARGNEPLREAYVVFRQKQHFQAPPHSAIVVDDARSAIDERDDQLGKVIRGSRLARKEKRVRHHLTARIAEQAVVEHEDVKHVEQLALVLVDTLDLAVEDRVGIHHLAVRRPQPAGKRQLGLPLRLPKLLAETGVPNERQKVL